ncbi:hypothetical protein NPIL_402321 [Nephila pilipes]|uniref:Uncharacterized protein n=1 Tax=Nephila pilipes TaxID=299642 RepID=A0A8X6QN60_NEPPI|nr:hypothetical protein NPIL_402321 [Nephila pilipes]
MRRYFVILKRNGENERRSPRSNYEWYSLRSGPVVEMFSYTIPILQRAKGSPGSSALYRTQHSAKENRKGCHSPFFSSAEKSQGSKIDQQKLK